MRVSLASRSFLRRGLASNKVLPGVSAVATPNAYPSNNNGIIRRTVFDETEGDLLSWYRTAKILKKVEVPTKPGSKAFVSEIEETAVVDLFFQYATTTTDSGAPSLDLQGVHNLLEGIGESHDDETVRRLFADADIDGSGCVDLQVK